ncbi:MULTISPECIES: SDR family oxidoreductase [unclassified Pseudoalteromonas]|uniref:SDR family NAD(P)-dependent oxidoreductase n=1 Tax=unclassified Pseudoalteromonas TaxID=194690 RepID=UPI00209691AF|nr:SDR family oxidoreductase [Pseudoalteromonas sp. XMcav2-N]MCO7187505.1 SDR family oxidoreductase [Pseudoalteromonas sp. XMcav2-N]
MTYTNTALITGASSGIGLELARLHAQQGGDLVLVARSEGKLNTLKNELEQAYGVNACVITADLTDPDSAQQIYTATRQQGIEVDILINNAGFGGHGFFHERELQADLEMIQVNISSLVALTHLFVQDMTARKSGRILNVSSTASFIPGPLQATYYATKAFVTSFSQALAEELKEQGISVTTLCPGAVATEFAKTGNLEELAVFKQGKSATSVAKCGYQAMQKGKLLAFNEPVLNFLLNWIVPLLPRSLVLSMSRRTMEK